MELIRYDSLIKYNENHDDRGRFASSDGAAGMQRMHERVSQPDGGFTYQPKSGVEPAEGFAVSPYPQYSFAKDAKDLTPSDIVKYYQDHVDIFEKEDHFIGAWHDPETGRVFLDVSVVSKTADEAIKLARAHDQIAYFDLKAGKSVTVNRDASSGGVAKGELLKWRPSPTTS